MVSYADKFDFKILIHYVVDRQLNLKSAAANSEHQRMSKTRLKRRPGSACGNAIQRRLSITWRLVPTARSSLLQAKAIAWSRSGTRTNTVSAQIKVICSRSALTG